MLSQPVALSGRDGTEVGSGKPIGQLYKGDFGRHTGVIVVSSHPQSTTRPVIRPLAANASKLDGVNDTEGT